MRIIIDGDATPNIKEIISLAKTYNTPVIIYCDYAHEITCDYAIVFNCDVKSQSVDNKIINDLENEDILITQDYGLALLALGKTSFVINPIGFLYTKDNIDTLISKRYINAKLRRSNIRTRGPKKRTNVEKEKLLNLIENIIKNNKNA